MYIRLFSLLALVFSIASCKSKQEGAPQKNTSNATMVDVIVAQPKTIENKIEANGTVVANEYVELRPEVSGRLTYLNVPEGKFVEKGTLIAKVFDEDLQAQLAKTKVLLDLAEKNEVRLRKLLAVNGANQSDYDAALGAVNGYKADIAYTQSLIEKTIIKAPFSGVVGLRLVSPGAYVSPATLIATIQQVDKIKVDFTIPEQYASIIKKGASVDIETDALKQIKTKAIIIATEPQITASSRNLKVRALMQDGNINPGAFVKVYVQASKDSKAIMVPTGCIIPDDMNKQLVLVKNGKARFVNVKTGVREADNVEIISGVNPGDSVVVTGVLFARPNAALKVRSVKQLDR
ncbi:MAG: efflux RND transporter periplasmic adaptor subunit [Bacteroidota bacterium]|nr:efflux RND transporter periplasmic adaptor subunit [Bacteroidota bacterium]